MSETAPAKASVETSAAGDGTAGEPSGQRGFAAPKRARRWPPPAIRRLQKALDRLGWRLVKLLYAWPAARMRRSERRFVVISNPDRIGHLAAEPDCWLKQVALGEKRRVRPVMLVRRGRSANDAMLDLWRDHIEVVDQPIRRRLLRPYLEFPELSLDLGEGVVGLGDAADYAGVLARWGDRAPLVALPEALAARGRAALARLGVPEDAWFVCVHSREGGYSPKDEYMHAHRNSDIASFGAAMDAIAARGGWCVRMGDASMKPLPPRAGVVDYARSAEKSPEMDLFLCAAARFFLGNTSGLCLVSTVFGVPAVLVNMIPAGAVYGMAPADIAIPKLIAGRDGAALPFAEVFRRGIAGYRYAWLYEEAGLRVIDNAPEDIRDAALEMLDRLEGRDTPDTPEDAEWQARFRALLGPEHYGYHARGRLGRAFLRRYAALMP